MLVEVGDECGRRWPCQSSKDSSIPPASILHSSLSIHLQTGTERLLMPWPVLRLRWRQRPIGCRLASHWISTWQIFCYSNPSSHVTSFVKAFLTCTFSLTPQLCLYSCYNAYSMLRLKGNNTLHSLTSDFWNQLRNIHMSQRNWARNISFITYQMKLDGRKQGSSQLFSQLLMTSSLCKGYLISVSQG